MKTFIAPFLFLLMPLTVQAWPSLQGMGDDIQAMMRPKHKPAPGKQIVVCMIAPTPDANDKDFVLLCDRELTDCHLAAEKLNPAMLALVTRDIFKVAKTGYKVKAKDLASVMEELRSEGYVIGRTNNGDYTVARGRLVVDLIEEDTSVLPPPRTAGADGRPRNMTAAEKRNMDLIRSQKMEVLPPGPIITPVDHAVLRAQENYRRQKEWEQYEADIAAGVPVEQAGRRRPGGGPYTPVDTLMPYEDKSVTPDSPTPMDN